MSTPPSGEPPYPGSQPNQSGEPQHPNNAGQSYPNQDNPGQGYPNQDNPAQSYPNQGYPDQGFQNQPGYPQGYQQGPGGYQGYPQGYGGAPPAQPRNGLGITALVLGIVAVLIFFTVVGGIVLGLLALIFGIIGLRRVGKGVATNKGVSIAGIVLGAIGLLASVAFVAFFTSVFFNSGGDDLVQCTQQAGGDRAQLQQCQQQYEQQLERQLGRGGS